MGSFGSPKSEPNAWERLNNAVGPGNRRRADAQHSRAVQDEYDDDSGTTTGRRTRSISAELRGTKKEKELERKAKEKERNDKAEAKRQAAIAKANKGKPIERGGKKR